MGWEGSGGAGARDLPFVPHHHHPGQRTVCAGVCVCVCVCVGREGGRLLHIFKVGVLFDGALVHCTHTEHGLQKLCVLKQGLCQVDNTIEIVPKAQSAILRLGDHEHTGNMGSRTRRGHVSLLCLPKDNDSLY